MVARVHQVAHVVVVYVVDQDVVVQKVNRLNVPHVIIMAIVVLVAQAIMQTTVIAMLKYRMEVHVQLTMNAAVAYAVDQNAVVQKVNQQDVLHAIVMVIVLVVVQIIT